MSEKMPLTSTHWGVYRAEVVDGKLAKLHDFEDDVDPSPIGNGIVGTLDAPTRVTAPMVRRSWLEDGPGSRTNLRGKDAFVEVTWDEVNKLVADELRRVQRDHGQNAIYAGSYGWASAGRFHHAQSQMKRFLNCFGGFTSSLNTYSFAAAEVIVPHVLGNYRDHMNRTTSWRSIAAEGELVVSFGGIPVKNGQIEAGGTGRHVQREGLRMAREAGVEFVNISPLRSDMEDELDAEWWAARPTSDVAIMLGLAHTIYTEGLHDAAFLAQYCSGFDQFAPYLIGEADGQPKDANWASALSEIPADDIRVLARKMAAKRAVVSVSWSLTRSDHGEQPFWMAITLAAMLGQIGLEGGGVAFGFSAENSIGGDTRLTPGASLPMGKNAVSDIIPVARVTEMLEKSGASHQYDGKTLQFPDIKLIWWSGGNPYHHHQDLNRFAKAWEKPDTIIVNDWCWTATAKRADIVLPVTTHVEREDLQIAPRDPYIVTMKKAVEPPVGVRNDHQVFKGIAAELGVEETFTEGRSEEEWLRWIWDKTRQNPRAEGMGLPDWDELQAMGWYKTPDQEKPTVMMRAFREDPVANALNTPSGKIEIYSDVVAGFGSDDCAGHAVWREP
jgi:biotin/methionine sulfoxide reductase